MEHFACVRVGSAGETADDLPTNFKAPVQQTDFDKRVVMIPILLIESPPAG